MIKNISELFLLEIDGQSILSPWGDVMWQAYKKELYREILLDSPSEKICYSESFINSVKNLQPDRKWEINKTIDDFVRYVEGEAKRNLPSLDFKALKGNPVPPSTHEMDAWSNLDAKRIFCHKEGEQWILDKLDKGLH